MNGALTGSHIHTWSRPERMTSDPCSAWGRVIAVKLFTRASNTQWLDNLITSMTLIKNSGCVAPFPYLGIAAGITVQILEIIQVSLRSFALLGFNHCHHSPPIRIETIFVILRQVWF